MEKKSSTKKGEEGEKKKRMLATIWKCPERLEWITVQRIQSFHGKNLQRGKIFKYKADTEIMIVRENAKNFRRGDSDQGQTWATDRTKKRSFEMALNMEVVLIVVIHTSDV